MSTTVKVQIQQRIDTSSNWTTANPKLLLGEIGWESNTKKYKIGDGNTLWAALAYAPGSGGYTAGTGVSISASNVITASAVALTTVQTAANQTAHLALTTQEGDVVVRSDENKSYVRNSGTAGSMADFTLLATPTDAVLSVNGNTGAITADQLAAAIEAASDSNTFTDADHTKLNSALTTSDLLDEDNFATDSATKAPSQQSTKAYVDASSLSLIDEDNLGSDSATRPPSQQSVKAYVDAQTLSLLDEDNLGSDSATRPPSQQSVKAYVDTADALKANLSGATFTGDVVFTGDAANVTWDKSTDDLIFNDNAKAIFGTTSDGLEIFHDGTNNYIDAVNNHATIIKSGTSDLFLQGNPVWITDEGNSHTYFKGTSGGASELYYDGSLKLQTISTGIRITPSGTTSTVNASTSTSSDAFILGVNKDGTDPTEFAIKTQASGGSSVERMRIDSSGVTVTGTVSDSKGDLRKIPQNYRTSAYVLVVGDAGKCITITTGGVTVNPSIFSAGDAVTIVNHSGSNQTITQGSSFTLYNTADGATGNRTLAGRGMATLFFTDHDIAYISGAGLS